MKIVLHDYWRSSASYRVRICLNLKRVSYETVPVNLLTGEQAGAENRAINPQGFVPTLVVDGRPLVQSLAIVDWLDANFPEPPMVSKDPFERSGQLARALVIRPKVLLMDEPTEGIQPNIIAQIGRVIAALRDAGGMAIVLVEQYFDFAWDLGDRFAVMERGQVVLGGERDRLQRDDLHRLLAGMVRAE